MYIFALASDVYGTANIITSLIIIFTVETYEERHAESFGPNHDEQKNDGYRISPGGITD